MQAWLPQSALPWPITLKGTGRFFYTPAPDLSFNQIQKMTVREDSLQHIPDAVRWGEDSISAHRALSLGVLREWGVGCRTVNLLVRLPGATLQPECLVFKISALARCDP